MRKFATFAVIAALISTTVPAQAIDNYGVDIYMSAPTVQGTAVSTGLTAENFNALTVGACPASIAIGAISGDCAVSAVGTYGGATADATDSTPTTGGAGSNYASTSAPSTTVTIDLNEPAKYLGLWWSAGSPSNVVELYSGEDRVSYMTTANLMTLLNSGSVTSVGGTSYDTNDYKGNPRNNTLAAAEPFLYLNLYGEGGASFDRIVLSGGGFEFDNISVSDLQQAPSNGEIQVEFIAGENDPADQAEPLANTGIDSTLLLGVSAALVASGLVLRRTRKAKNN